MSDLFLADDALHLVPMMSESAFQEDPLSYLPRKPLREYGRGEQIYGAGQRDESIYVAVAGHVLITGSSQNGGQVTHRIVGVEEVFGEAALVTDVRPEESAVAIDKVTLMAWSRSEIEAQIQREPRLAIALLQTITGLGVRLHQRLQQMRMYETAPRVALGLIQITDDIGKPMTYGALRLPGLTQKAIAGYVGTSREIVAIEMNRLRRSGMIQYSRKYVDVYVQALRDSLREQGVEVPRRLGGAYQTA